MREERSEREEKATVVSCYLGEKVEERIPSFLEKQFKWKLTPRGENFFKKVKNALTTNLRNNKDEFTKFKQSFQLSESPSEDESGALFLFTF